MITGFAGKMYLHGSSATEKDAYSLSASLISPKGARIETSVCGSLAIAVCGRTLLSTSKPHQFLIKNEHTMFVASGSIYNRESVIPQLGCNKDIDDLQMMKTAWLHARNDAPELLDGDWMFVAYDIRKQELLLSRSWGHSSLYYYIGNNFIAFATHPSSLTALPDVPKEPDIDSILQILCASPSMPSLSTWKDIKQLQPASKIIITHGKLKEHIWWRPTFIEKAAISDESETLRTFVHLFDSAVKRRLPTTNQVGATLSAGLDSSSVCAFATRALSEQNKPLHAWTSIPQYPNEAYSSGKWLTNETDLASQAAAEIGNINHIITSTENVNPIDTIRLQVYHTGRPLRSAGNFYWIDNILEQAVNCNCGVLLTGQGGNSTVSWSPHKIQTLPKNIFFPNTPWKQYIHYMNQDLLLRLKRAKRALQSKSSGKPIYSLINPQYLESPNFKRFIADVDFKKTISHAGAAQAHMNLMDIWYHMSFWNGIEVRDPTLDVKLTEFLVSLPDNMFYRDHLDRRIIRLGMQGILPDQIRLNTQRGQQASDIAQRIRKFANHIEETLRIIEATPLANDLLNISFMRQILERLKRNETGNILTKDCSMILLPGLSIGLFLASIGSKIDLSVPLA